MVIQMTHRDSTFQIQRCKEFTNLFKLGSTTKYLPTTANLNGAATLTISSLEKKIAALPLYVVGTLISTGDVAAFENNWKKTS